MVTLSIDEVKALSHVLKSTKHIFVAFLNVPLPKKKRSQLMQSIECLDGFIERFSSSGNLEGYDNENV